VYQPVDPDEIDLVEYFAVIWRHRWMIAALCLVAMALTVAWTLNKPRLYSCSTTIVPPLASMQKQSGFGGGLGRMGNSMLRSVIDTGSLGDMYVEILNSREVADALIDRFDLMRVYRGVAVREDARARLRGGSKIETSKEGSVKITVTDADPNLCTAVAKAYVEELDRRNKRLSAGEATSKRIFLENRLKEVETKLSQIDSIPSREAKTQELVYEMLVQEYELAKIEEAKSMPTIQVLDQAMVPELPIGRATFRKGMMAGIAALMLGVFVAFAHEYVRDARRRRQVAIPAGRYDIDLPSADKSAARVSTEAAGSSPAGPPKQQP
jgi:tyrosine-protein kinase Etk/Wzc